MTLDMPAAAGKARRRADAAGLAPALAVAIASLTLPLAVTPPAVAIGALAADVGAAPDAAQWVLNAYNVTFAACMLAAGGLADLFGRRKVLIAGLWLFGTMSLLCGLVSDIVLIDVFRGLQGIGAAGILTSGAAILAATYTGPARARAFGALGASFGLGLALGPLGAGLLVDLAGWRTVFFLNVVLVAVVFAFLPRIPESSDPAATTVDWIGLGTFSTSLFLLSLGFVQGAAHGWGALSTVVSFVGFAVFLGLFVLAELRQRRPMFDLSLFRRPTFVAVVCQPFTITFGFVVLLVFLPPYFQAVDGMSAGASGGMLLPLTLPVLLIPLLAGRIAAKVPLRIMLGTSSLLIAAGSLWLVVLQPSGGWVRALGPLLLFGIGVGSAFGVMDNAAVSVVPAQRAGMASGIFNTMRIAGEGIAIAGAASLLGSLTAARLGTSLPGGGGDGTRVAGGEIVQGHLTAAQDALGPVAASAEQKSAALFDGFTSALHVSFVILAVLALAGAIATFVVIKDADLDPEN
jgi:MFS family permease